MSSSPFKDLFLVLPSSQSSHHDPFAVPAVFRQHPNCRLLRSGQLIGFPKGFSRVSGFHTLIPFVRSSAGGRDGRGRGRGAGGG